MDKRKLNRVIIKRNWRGQIVEVSIEIVSREPEGRPPLELSEVVGAIFSSQKEG